MRRGTNEKKNESEEERKGIKLSRGITVSFAVRVKILKKLGKCWKDAPMNKTKKESSLLSEQNRCRGT